ncbi:Campylobacter phage CGC-2007, Cje0229 [uncultured Caudovirales phage]|uniref:Campylobacter phage CGC-2007, Cje0229 n=1 Tax=uncultured Caudovirales phage TaxID=2100421 RepID=A0A6J5QJA0_9CAUD|nr:Campylobacter phage CGC-2007, Cje0229 [uncultured Caudovirales phage]CAB4198142.1 Campylobacter phage CGC-2007, Cje0229 [uncultured Caudovirales phage]CAB4211330.1 Campylobacter phage CGC-2007, Cje0229 [uncultured Caudovirales phage]CAB5227395.1 Campylobacter phage CGC-2007, Cje0229 [uncultured Caudovirales phage]
MFTTPLDLRANTAPNEWVLLRSLVWHGDRRIEVPAGFITDLASIPRVFRNVLNVNGASRRAAVLHDWLYCSQPFTRREADRMLKAALLAEGEHPIVAQVYYLGVRIGGSRPWNNRFGQGLKPEDMIDGA